MTVVRAMARLLAALLLWALCVSAVMAFDATDISRIESAINSARAVLAETVAATDPHVISAEAIAQQRTFLANLKAEAEKTAKELDQPQADVAAQIAQLGPAPGQDQQESVDIGKQRTLLNDRAAQLLGLRKQLELIGVEADQHFSRLSTAERDQFLNRVFASEKSVLDPRLWLAAITASGIFVARLGNLIGNWWLTSASAAQASALLATIAGLALATLALWLLPRIMRGVFSPALRPPDAPDAKISRARLLWHGIFGYLHWLALSGVLGLGVWIGLDAAGVMTTHFDLVLRALFDIAIPVLFYTGAAYMVCRPANPDARLVAVGDAAARKLVLVTFLASAVNAAGTVLTNIATALSIPVSFAVGISALSALLLVFLLGYSLVVIQREARKDSDQGNSRYFLSWMLALIPFLWVLLATALVSLLSGFVALGLFIAGNVLQSAMLAVVLGVLHAFTHAVADAASETGSRTNAAFKRFTGWSADGMARSILILRTVADLGTALLAVLGLAALWAVSLLDFTQLIRKAASGFEIGNISISPTGLLGALFILLLGVAITRYVASWLEKRVLSATKLDRGVRDSVRTSLGYTGYLLAVLFALSAAGVSFSNVALIAGALGVGIGFGLQSIVNNFVSGLILLAERHVRVGDWIVTPAGEGIVRRINVRATEIESFDHGTIIIPNSSLITGAVTNWTLRDTLGAFSLKLAVSYDADVDKVTEILRGIANRHPKIMRHPEPTVRVSDLKPLNMEFEIRMSVLDVLEMVNVAGDLRGEILRSLGKSLLFIQPPVAIMKHDGT